MEQVLSQRTRWVSRSLAAIAFMIAVRIAYGLITYVFTTELTFSAGSLFFEFAFIICMVGACSFFLWLAVRFWTQFEPAHILLLAAIPALLVSGVIAVWLPEWLEIVVQEYRPEADVVSPLTGASLFVGVLAAGIVYLWTKRLLYSLLKLTELIKPIQFRVARKQYLGWLAFFFWSALFSVFFFLGDVNCVDIHNGGLSFFFILLSPLVAMIFYKFCFYCFVTRPLKRLQAE